jgi:hypothetical protein
MNPLDHIHPLDFWTRNAGQALNVFYLRDSVRTPLGLVFGGAMSSLSVLFEPGLQAVKFADFSAMPWWGWLPVGILIMHVPTIIQLLKRPSVGSYTMDTLFELIDRGDFSAAERRQLYRRLIERFVELAAADHSLQRESDALAKRASD